MLEIIENIEEVDLSGLPLEDKKVVDVYKKLKQFDGKVIFKKKTIKGGTFLNIYCYDQYCWKYLLRYSFKIS